MVQITAHPPRAEKIVPVTAHLRTYLGGGLSEVAPTDQLTFYCGSTAMSSLACGVASLAAPGCPPARTLSGFDVLCKPCSYSMPFASFAPGDGEGATYPLRYRRERWLSQCAVALFASFASTTAESWTKHSIRRKSEDVWRVEVDFLAHNG